jgi:hypothetical protein
MNKTTFELISKDTSRHIDKHIDDIGDGEVEHKDIVSREICRKWKPNRSWYLDKKTVGSTPIFAIDNSER